MAEIKKEEVEFPACGTLWQGNCIRWQHFIFLFMYIVQLYKEDWGILHMLGCQAVAHPSTEQMDRNILVEDKLSPDLKYGFLGFEENVNLKKFQHFMVYECWCVL